MSVDEYLDAYGHTMTDEHRMMVRFAGSFKKPTAPPGGKITGGDKPSCSRRALTAWVSGEFIPSLGYRCGGGDDGNATLSGEVGR